MQRVYKELRWCRMCKKKFVVDKSPEKKYRSRAYCGECYDKYIKKKD